MNWTKLLTEAAHYNYMVADNLMAMVSDDDLAWKPATGSNWMTAGQCMHHMTNACGYCCRGFLTGDWGMPEGAGDHADGEPMLPPAEALPSVESVQAARDLLSADKALCLQMIAEAGEEKLDTHMTVAPWNPGCERSLGEHFMDMILHLQSHKNQLYYYLKLMGRDVNTEHLWGM